MAGANPPPPEDPPLNIALLCTPHTLALAREALDRLLCSTTPSSTSDDSGSSGGEGGPSDSEGGPDGEGGRVRGLQGMVYVMVPGYGVSRLNVPQTYGSTAFDLVHALQQGYDV